jgi:hypothetical protein
VQGWDTRLEGRSSSSVGQWIDGHVVIVAGGPAGRVDGGHMRGPASDGRSSNRRSEIQHRPYRGSMMLCPSRMTCEWAKCLHTLRGVRGAHAAYVEDPCPN